MTKHDLEQLFPQLAGTRYFVTSPFDEGYCIAFAAGDTRQWRCPDEAGEAFWPAGVPRESNVEAFVLAFGLMGFGVSVNAEFEAGFEKVAIYVDRSGRPTHAARQLPNGLWTSKLGKAEDIQHELLAVADGTVGTSLYGRVAVILKRSAPPLAND